MESQPPSVAHVPDPFHMTRREAKEFLSQLARSDPLRAWQFGVQYMTKEGVDDTRAVLGIIAVMLLITIGLLFVIAGPFV